MIFNHRFYFFLSTILYFFLFIISIPFSSSSQSQHVSNNNIKNINIWPYPYFFQSSNETGNGKGNYMKVEKINFMLYDIKTSKFLRIEDDDVIYDCIKRYEKYMYKRSINKGDGGVGIDYVIKVKDVKERKLVYGVDEKYKLKIEKEKIEMECESIFGVLRGIETFVQMINEQGVIENIPILVDDKPRYLWRGFLIDVVNHYLSINTLKRLLDSMSYHKLNVLHLHMIDSSSFPMEIKKYPLLQKKGSYDPLHAVFSVVEMKDLANYAYKRGIRILPELEAPGHGYSWGLGYPETVAKCPSAKDLQDIPLNPIEPKTTEISKEIIDVLIDIFDDEFLHFGGDEVKYECWEEDQDISKYMKEHGYSGGDMDRKFMEPLYEYAVGKIPISWHERAFEESQFKLPSNMIIQNWRILDDITKLTNMNYPVINSAGWYIDQMQPVPPHMHYAMLDVWRDMYKVEMDDYVSEEKRHLIIGGCGAMWSEQINDFVIEGRVYPKACAFAERLWSQKSVNIQTEEDKVVVKKRLMHHICHNLLQRGVHSSPIDYDYCKLD